MAMFSRVNPICRGPPACMNGSACSALSVERVKVSQFGSPAPASTRPWVSVTAMAPKCRHSGVPPRVVSINGTREVMAAIVASPCAVPPLRPHHLALRALGQLVAGVDGVGAEAVVGAFPAQLDGLAVDRRDGVDHLRDQQLMVLAAHAH